MPFREFHQTSSPVRSHYYHMYKNHTFYNSNVSIQTYKNSQREHTMADVLKLCSQVVDSSDPDFHESNMYHNYQAAEKAVDVFDDERYMVAALIHDVGKVLILWGEPQWNVTGDTFVLGCTIPTVSPFSEYHRLNSDHMFYSLWEDPELGRYKPNVGLDNVVCTFGHDEYMFQTLLKNKHRHALPPSTWDVIRYHSLYPWHSGNAYRKLMNEKDSTTLENCQKFQRCDLYTKQSLDSWKPRPSFIEECDRLLEKYFPEPLLF